MRCQHCGGEVTRAARFCDQCGTPLGEPRGQSLRTGGGDIHGGTYQAGRDIHIGASAPSPVAEYEAKWSWRSPLTMAALTWISVGLGALGVLAGWQSLLPLFALRGGRLSTSDPSPVWTIGLALIVLGLAVTLSLRRIAKHRTQQFFSLGWLPAVTGWGGRVGLAKLQGRCPNCGGSLRFYDKPMTWIDDLSTGKRKVTKRGMAAEWVKNDAHWWLVDKTDVGVGGV